MDQQTLHVVVTIANATFTTFRIAAHVPQLLAVVRDTSGARAISVGSWVMFAIANLSNAVYALVIADDWLMFGINLLSTASCAAIGGVAVCKQRRVSRLAEKSPSRHAHCTDRHDAFMTTLRSDRVFQVPDVTRSFTALSRLAPTVRGSSNRGDLQ